MALTKVTQTVIATGAISSSQIANGSITADHLTGVNTDHVSEGSTNVYYTDTRARSSVSVTGGNLSYDSGTGVIQLTTDTIRGAISVTDAGGDGSLAYSAGVITYTGPSAAETRAHFSGSTGVSYNSSTGAFTTSAIPNGSLSNSSITINSNSVDLGASVTLDTDDVGEGSTNLYYTDTRVDSRLASGNVGNIVTTGYIAGPSTFTIDPAAVGDNTGTVVIAGNLQVDGTTTTINSTTVSIDDLNFTIASDAADSSAANGAGITINGAGAIFAWSHTLGSMTLNKELRLDNNKGLFFSNAAANATLGIKADASDNITFRQNGSWDRLVIKNTGVDVSGNIVVTGTVDGVDIAARDAVLTSTTTTANAALPKAGGTMTGALTTRDVTVSNGYILVDGGTTSNTTLEAVLWARSQIGASIPQLNVQGDQWQFGGGGTLDTSPTMTVDYGSGNVGIGTSGPLGKLHVRDGSAQAGIYHTYAYDGSAISIEATEPAIQLMSEDSGTHGGSLLWRYGNNAFAAIANPTTDAIDFTYGVTTNNDFMMHSGTNMSSYLKIMSIGADGNVGIGTDAPGTYQLAVNSGTAGVSDPLAGIYVNGQRNGVVYNLVSNNTANAANRGSGIQFRHGGFLSGAIIHRTDGTAASGDAPGYMTFHTSSDNSEDLTERLRIDSAGTVIVTGAAGNANKGILQLSTQAATYQLVGGNNIGYLGYKTGGYHRWFGSDGLEDMRIDASGKVGIGTDNPQSILNISDTAPILRIDCDSDQDSKILFVENGSPAVSIFYEGSAGTGTANNLHIRSELSGSETNLVTVGLDGNVGIGAASPGANLAFGGSNAGIWLNNDGSNPFGIDTVAGELRLFTGNSAAYQMKFGKMATDGTTFTSHLTIGDDGSNRGHVGIGTDSPQTKLQIVGSTSSEASSGGTLGIRQKGDGGGDGITITSSHANSGRIFKDSNGALHIYNTGGNQDDFVITNTGNVGIGTASPTGYRLVVKNTSEDLLNLHNSTDGLDSLISFTNPGGTLGRVQGIDNGGLGFDVGNNAGGIISNAMSIDNTGNVGIGTANPVSAGSGAKSLNVSATGEARLVLSGDSNNSGDAGQLDAAIYMLTDGGVGTDPFGDTSSTNAGAHGYSFKVKNYSGANTFDMMVEADGTATNLMHMNTAGDVVFGFGSTSVSAGAKFEVASTTSMVIPKGTTAQRPGSAVSGAVRFNTTLGNLEQYDGSSWKMVSTVYGIDYLVLGGGGSGGDCTSPARFGGGGGAGGLRTSYGTVSGRASTAENPLIVTSGHTLTITVGAGASGGVTTHDTPGTQGSNSSITGTSGITNITSLGGGGGGGNTTAGSSGGSGGGGSESDGVGRSGTIGQGFDGGTGTESGDRGGGGGGTGANGTGTDGGAGTSVSITGSAVTYGGGGATSGSGGSGGGGAGSTNGTANLGGGGGAAGSQTGAGGSGVVILRIPTANYSGTTTGSPTVTTNGDFTVIKFTSSGTYTT